jgi:hypothetical protein
MDKSINVLVFPCGAENGIEIHQALKDVVNIKLFGASGKDDHGRFVYERYIGNLPYINSDNFVDFLNQIIFEHKIDIIIPTHDDVVVKLAKEQNNINSTIAIPGLEQALICRSKKKTYNLFSNFSFCPKLYSSLPKPENFPIFAKPDEGQGGKGVVLINTENAYLINDESLRDYVLCEFLPGVELTIDCFTDRHGKLRFVGPRKRERIFGGISTRTSTVDLTPEINQIANEINYNLKMNGLWYFQVKQDINNVFKLMEISVRTSGSMNLYRALGINFPLLTIYNALGYDISILKNNYILRVDRFLKNRYEADFFYDTIYIDFDDTIIKNGHVNSEVMMFLYNAKMFNKKIILITKHENDLDVTLESFSIHKGIFNEIIHIKMKDAKYKHIRNKQTSIFIDNSFIERFEVKKELGIPVFDVDAIDSLINWKY